ncbi:MAG: DUF1206 domain-containing protein [Verrucomicrobiales bacterium]|nr:DUF1206 domain-containing protein [Verrucomicrobiales bacterium]
MNHSVPQSISSFERSTAHRAATWFGKIGYSAKAFLYATLGWLAIQSAVGANSGKIDPRAALQWLVENSFGKILTAALLIGLAAYALYRFSCALFNFEQNDDDTIGVARRIGYFATGLVYAALAFFCGKLLAGNGGNSNSSISDRTEMFMAHPAGRIALGLIAIGILCAAFAQAKRAWTGEYKERFENSELPGRTEKFVNFSAKFGLYSRAVIFAILGVFAGIAALFAQPSSAGGMNRAFSFLESAKFGTTLFAVIAAGFIAYSIYAAVIAWCGNFGRER